MSEKFNYFKTFISKITYLDSQKAVGIYGIKSTMFCDYGGMFYCTQLDRKHLPKGLKTTNKHLSITNNYKHLSITNMM